MWEASEREKKAEVPFDRMFSPPEDKKHEKMLRRQKMNVAQQDREDRQPENSVRANKDRSPLEDRQLFPVPQTTSLKSL
ncbi:hypothetical protein GN956_G9824 [Arapaima gigas]